MDKRITILDGSRDGTREVETNVGAERLVGFLMTSKKDGGPLPDHPEGDKSFWKGYEAALRDLIDEYDLVDAIADSEDFEEWLADDEQERRGL